MPFPRASPRFPREPGCPTAHGAISQAACAPPPPRSRAQQALPQFVPTTRCASPCPPSPTTTSIGPPQALPVHAPTLLSATWPPGMVLRLRIAAAPMAKLCACSTLVDRLKVCKVQFQSERLFRTFMVSKLQKFSELCRNKHARIQCCDKLCVCVSVCMCMSVCVTRS